MHLPSFFVPARVAALVLCGSLLLAGCGGDSAAALVESGKVYLAKKDAAAATIQFKAALQKDPQLAEARYLLGEALLKGGDPAGAAVELAKAQDEHFDDNRVMPPLARALLLSGDAKKLTTLYSDVTLTDATANASLKASVANAWSVLGDPARARTALDASLASAAGYPPALILQARLAAGAGRIDEALATVEQVLAREDDNYEAWHLKGEILTNARNDLRGGEAAFRKALAASRAFVPSHLALVTLQLRAGNVEGARAQAKSLREALPNHPQTMYVDAQIALIDKDLKKARELTQQLFRIAPENVGLLQLAGLIDAEGGALVQAETHFSKALQINPELPLARRNLAKTYLRLGQPVKALAALEPLTGADTHDAEALSLAGETQLQLGDAKAAEQLFQRAARLTPDDPRLQTALALMTLSRGDAQTAFSQLEAISARTPDTASDMALVSARLKRQEYDAALQALDAMAKKQASGALVAELRGRVHTARHDNVAARAAYEQALAIEPKRFSAIASLAALDALEGNGEQARKRLEAAVDAEPRNHTARMALADLRARQGAGLPELTEILSAGIKAAPDEAGPRVQLIDLLLARKQFKEALTVAQEATAVLPADANVLDALGRSLVQTGDTQQAISTFRQLASIDTRSARAHLRLAELLKSTGNRDGAIASLRRALEVEPGSDIVQTRLMDLLITDGHPTEALEMARGMQQRAPGAALGYLLEGAIQRRVNAPDPAIEAYKVGVQKAVDKSALAVELHKTLLSRDRDAEARRFAATWSKEHPDDLAFEYHLATVAILAKDLARAETLLLHVVAARPNHAMALNNLAWVLTNRNRPGAVAYAQKAVDLLPNRPALMDTLALALAADKQWPKALELQKKAVEIAPGDMGLRLSLAKIALQAGDKTLARSELDRLAALGPKLQYHDEVTRMLKLL